MGVILLFSKQGYFLPPPFWGRLTFFQARLLPPAPIFGISDYFRHFSLHFHFGATIFHQNQDSQAQKACLKALRAFRLGLFGPSTWPIGPSWAPPGPRRWPIGPRARRALGPRPHHPSGVFLRACPSGSLSSTHTRRVCVF